jgi:hypothetical protein
MPAPLLLSVLPLLCNRDLISGFAHACFVGVYFNANGMRPRVSTSAYFLPDAA